MSLNTTSKCSLNTSRDDDSLNSFFQCMRTLSEKKFLLPTNLNLPWCNFRPSPVVQLLFHQRRGVKRKSKVLPSASVCAAGHLNSLSTVSEK